MGERNCSITITAALISMSQMLSPGHSAMHDQGISFFSQEYLWTKNELMPEACREAPMHPCQEDEEVEAHGTYELLEPEFEEKSPKKKKYASKEQA